MRERDVRRSELAPAQDGVPLAGLGKGNRERRAWTRDHMVSKPGRIVSPIPAPETETAAMCHDIEHLVKADLFDVHG